MNLFTKVTIAYGPSIYNKDAIAVSASDASEVNTLQNNLLVQ